MFDLVELLATASGWDLTLSLLTVMTPLVGIPLTAITFYLRDLKEHQTGKYADLTRRVETLDAGLDQCRQTWVTVERDFVGKEEWLRESMVARRKLEQLAEAVVRIETELESRRGADDGGRRRPATFRPDQDAGQPRTGEADDQR